MLILHFLHAVFLESLIGLDRKVGWTDKEQRSSSNRSRDRIVYTSTSTSTRPPYGHLVLAIVVEVGALEAHDVNWSGSCPSGFDSATERSTSQLPTTLWVRILSRKEGLSLSPTSSTGGQDCFLASAPVTFTRCSSHPGIDLFGWLGPVLHPALRSHRSQSRPSTPLPTGTLKTPILGSSWTLSQPLPKLIRPFSSASQHHILWPTSHRLIHRVAVFETQPCRGRRSISRPGQRTITTL